MTPTSRASAAPVAEVRFERAGAVAVITLDVPDRRNVLSGPMVAAIGQAFDAAEADDGVRCVVLTGAGKAFCAGAHLDTLEQAAAGQFEDVRTVYEGFLRVLASPLPTIAAVNGAAVGAGFNLALACDIRLAGASARFDTRFAALHLHPGGGHTWLLTRAVGSQQAMLAALFGRAWDADAARAVGLVADVVDDAALLATAVELGQQLAAQSGAYVRRTTQTLRLAASDVVSHADVLAAETEAQRWSLGQPEFLAGLEAIRAQIAARR